MKIQRLLFVCVIGGFMFFSHNGFAPPGNGWMPSYTSQLGISVVNAPAPNQPFDTLNGKITNPAFLQKLGFKQAKKGMAVKITHAGNVSWTTTLKGKKIHPCIIQVHVQDFMSKLTPEKGTLTLKK